MAVLRLVIQTRPLVAPIKPAQPMLASANLVKAYFPGQGLPFSILVHGIIFGILSYVPLSSLVPPLRLAPRPPQETVIIHRTEPRVVMYLPLLRGGEPATMLFPSPRIKERIKAPPVTEERAPRGLSYPGPQPILSNPPNPTNEIQTVLQPDLDNPPILIPPLPLPNMVQVADAAVIPRLELPPLQKPPEDVKPEEPPPPKPPEEVKPPEPPKPPEIKPEVKAPEPVAPPIKIAPTTSADIPKLILPDIKDTSKIVLPPVAPTTPLPKPAPPPKKNPEPVKKPEPAQAAVPAQNPSPPKAKENKAAEVPRAPVEQPKTEPLPKVAEKPKESPAAKPLPDRGPDRQNILALTPFPAPAEPQIKIPSGEMRGRFAISPEPNLDNSETKPGSKSGAPPRVNEAENRVAAPVPGKAPAKASQPASNGNASSKTGSEPKSGAASGTAAGSGSASKKPFAGITIVGGSYEPGTAEEDPAPVVQARRPLQTSYGLTVISTENSGGGLPFLDIFSHEQIYTVYLDMRRDELDPAPSWTLEFAVLRDPDNATDPPNNPGKTQEGLVLPFPAVKEQPVLPSEVVAKHLQKMIIVYAVINTEGKMEQVSVKESPDPLLNEPLLSALRKWVFRPARLRGEPVAVKALLGIPLWLAE